EFFPLALRLIAKRASPGAPSFSDYCNDVGRLPIFARWESENCWPVLNPAWSSGAVSAEPSRDVKPRAGISPRQNRGLESVNWPRTPHQALRKTEPTAKAIIASFLLQIFTSPAKIPPEKIKENPLISLAIILLTNATLWAVNARRQAGASGAPRAAR